MIATPRCWQISPDYKKINSLKKSLKFVQRHPNLKNGYNSIIIQYFQAEWKWKYLGMLSTTILPKTKSEFVKCNFSLQIEITYFFNRKFYYFSIAISTNTKHFMRHLMRCHNSLFPKLPIQNKNIARTMFKEQLDGVLVLQIGFQSHPILRYVYIIRAFGTPGGSVPTVRYYDLQLCS